MTTGAGQAVTPGSAITITPYAKTDAFGHKVNVVLGDNQTWNIATGRKLSAFTIEGNYSLTLGYNSDYAGTVWTWNYNDMGTTDIKYGTLQVADGGMVPGGTVTVHGGATLYDAGEYGGTSILRPVVLTGGTTGATLAGVSALAYGGTLKVANLGGALAVGQPWKLFGFSKRGGTSKFSNDSDFGVPGYSGPNLPTLDSAKQWMFNYLRVRGSAAGVGSR